MSNRAFFFQEDADYSWLDDRRETLPPKDEFNRALFDAYGNRLNRPSADYDSSGLLGREIDGGYRNLTH